jgi:hypothetical protein
LNESTSQLPAEEAPSLELARREIAVFVRYLEQKFPEVEPLLRDLILAVVVDDYCYTHGNHHVAEKADHKIARVDLRPEALIEQAIAVSIPRPKRFRAIRMPG